MLELKQLRLFVVAAENGGYSKAARSLYTSHSTISRAITELEKELGVKLVERTNKLHCLTPAGQLLLEEGKTLLEAAESLEEKVKEQDAYLK
jgi:DNA-binding transcriptional LysR family regulator